MKRILFLLFCLIFVRTLDAAVATPTAVSTITVVTSTVTVNSTAHGLAVNQGFCLSASAVCGVVATSTANSFTFTQAAFTACASSCGTVQPAKKVVWLQTTNVNGGYQVSYLLWETTITPVVNSSLTSAWSGASTAEVNAIKAGNVIEIPGIIFFPTGTSLASAESTLALIYSTAQGALAASVQPGAFFGNYLDGVGWLQ